ncbi:4082_t:CDS:1 [Racocetra fulgida]|uniref:4082_t:CDS:1 n=1 Tax=Racocetra fulgida TaxID=60492 RepID=A0A9N9B7S3_9GLOM|nr:4082_t:CDS:1 [Racocetra fulgida]
MEMLLSTSPDLKPSFIDRDNQLEESVTIPLTVAMKIFKKKLENRCIEIKHKDIPSNLVKNAKSACDRYNFLVHNDIKDSQGICGITGHWIIGSNKEWRNELNEIQQKEIQENTLKIPQYKPAKKKQNKWIHQGSLESKVERPLFAKRKGEQEVEHEEVKKKQKNQMSWADDAEIAFGDVEPQQALNSDSILKDSIDNLSIGNVESKESIKNGKGMEGMNDEQEIRALDTKLKKLSAENMQIRDTEFADDDDEDIPTPDIETSDKDVEFAKMNDDDDEEDILTLDIETSDKDVQAPDAGLILKGKNYSQDNDANATTDSEFLLKYAKVIYNALLAELESRQLLYEIDEKPRVSECPTGREKKRGQKRRKYENKLV